MARRSPRTALPFCIARAVATEPSVLLMDEPCSALDPIATRRIEELMLELMSYFLVREGQPPFELSADNTAAYFATSAAIRDRAKTGPVALLRQLVGRRRLAALVLDSADRQYLNG